MRVARKAGATSLRQVAEAMEARGVPATNGGTRWHAAAVQAIEARAARALQGEPMRMVA